MGPWLLLGLLSAPPEAPPPGSVHARELAGHAGGPAFDFVRPSRSYAEGPAPRVRRVVYGYYPYWVTAWDRVRWDLLTHIAFFAIEMNADGSTGAAHGWPDADFVATAHMNGVRADVCFTLFSGTGIATLVGSATSRARAIDSMIGALEAGAADGVNIDFEGVQAASRDGLTTFVRELREALDARGHAAAQISMAGPAVDWSAAFDFGALAQLIDVYFIMGYGYHWGGSGRAGPVGQLRVTESWRPHLSISMERTLDHYTSLTDAAGRARIVLGVPYYGEEWPVAGEEMHAATQGDGSSRTYAAARRALSLGRARRYDPDSENAWYAFESGGQWRQTWYDDEESLAAKYELVLEQEIGGVGMWALGYDEDLPELWQTLDAAFTAEPAPRPGSRQAPVRIDRFPFREANDTRLGPRSYFNRYSCAPTLPEYGREWVYQLRLCQEGQLRVTLTDGPGVDVDLHLLSAPEEGACLARDDGALDERLPAGDYWLVADTYVADYVPQAGAFQLEVDFQPAGGQADCVLAGQVDSDAAEVEGLVRPPAPPPPMAPEVVARGEGEDQGCGCRSAGGAAGSAPLLALVGVLALSGGRWRSARSRGGPSSPRRR